MGQTTNYHLPYPSDYTQNADVPEAIKDLAEATDTALGSKQNTIDNSHKLNADLVDDTSTTHKFVSTSEKTTWGAKYDKPSGRNTFNRYDISSTNKSRKSRYSSTRCKWQRG